MVYAPMIRTIEPHPADGGVTRNHNQWIGYFNAQGKVMMSAPDLYRAGRDRPNNLVESLRNDFGDTWLVTGTRVYYHTTDILDADIVHDSNSAVATPHSKRIFVPVYQYTTLSTVLESPEGVAYLRALFNTNDSAEIIAETLAALSGNDPEKTYIWTPDRSDRARQCERAVDFGFANGWFHVCGHNWPDGKSSRSRGVSVGPAPRE